MPTQIEKVYEPQRFEPAWAQWWIENGIFKASREKHRPDVLDRHPAARMSPACSTWATCSITPSIDVVVRWHRMLRLQHPVAARDRSCRHRDADGGGASARSRRYHPPASSDAKSSRSASGSGSAQSGGTILKQMIRLGTSCDWSRERFTLDPGLSRAVRETFVRLYEKDLIYRGEYMVNWCPRCFTAISDLETVHEETQGQLWHIAYPVVGIGSKSSWWRPRGRKRCSAILPSRSIRTTSATQHLHGKTVLLPLMNREIPIILDTMADPKFGTGVVKVTPAHDPERL